jgi:hypothetical protein
LMISTSAMTNNTVPLRSESISVTGKNFISKFL